MWTLRKYYGGQGGALPPTDPRILAMTEEQIDLEFEHILADKAERDADAKVYSDDGFDDYDNETEEMDSKLSDLPKMGREASDPYAGHPLPKAETSDEDEWEDVEIDDFDSKE